MITSNYKVGGWGEKRPKNAYIIFEWSLMKFAVMKFAQGKNPLYFKFYGFLRKSEPYESTVLPKVKVSKFRKQFLVTSILPKN